MSVIESLRRHLTRIDVALGVAALVGLALYLFVLPRHHPDAAARYTLTAAQAEERADAFLTESGWDLAGLQRHVHLYRNEDLLREMQEDLGRPEALRRLRETPGGHIPAYAWRARYIETAAAEDADRTIQAGSDIDEEEVEQSSTFIVRLTQAGEVWEYHLNDEGWEDERQLQALRRVERETIASVFGERTTDDPLDPVDAPPAIRLADLPDSVFADAFFFEREDTLWRQESAPRVLSEAALMQRFTRLLQETRQLVGAPPDTTLLSNVVTGTAGARTFRMTLPEGAPVAYALHHLDRTAWSPDRFQVEDVSFPPNTEGRLATVRLARSEPLAEQPTHLDVTVTAGGVLRHLDAQFETEESASSTLDDAASVAEGVLFALLSLILIIVFFKRLGARLIDTTVIRVDGIVIGVLMALTAGLISEYEFGVESFWIQLGIQVLIAAVTGIASGLFAGIIAGAGDSMTRAAWSKKVYAASLVRLGQFRNVFVGAALLRGLSLALILVGLHVVMLMLWPEAIITFENERFLNSVTLQPSLWITAQEGAGAYFTLLFVLLGAGTLMYRAMPRSWIVVGVVTLLFIGVKGSILDLAPAGHAWLAGGVVGLVLGMAYWAFDFVTCFVAYFCARVLWQISEGWLVGGSPLVIDVGIVALLLGVVLVLGLIGVGSGRTKREVGEYVPEYLQELAQQERLKRELEIAQQVQNSFLPRRMPKVEGVDVAAMCLAAQEVGGDYYDFIELDPRRLAIVVGDVSGKGIQAAFYMTLVKGMLQALCRKNTSPAAVMRQLNSMFYDNVPRGTFISMIYGVLDVEAQTFTFARAGHNPVILKRSPSQHADFVQPAGLALGLVEGQQFDDTIEEARLDLRRGDVVTFYTDGFSEAMNLRKEQYGDERLAHKVSDVGQLSASDILHAIAEDVHRFVEGMGRHDDMTMVVIKLD